MRDPCPPILELLEKYGDREATEAERSAVDAHLLTCPSCHAAWKRTERLKGLMKVSAEEPPGEGEFERAWRRIHQGITAEKRPSLREYLRSWFDLSPLFRKRILIPAAGVALALVLASTLLLKKIPSYPEPPVVEYVESQTCDVMVYEPEKTKVTVIWLFEAPEKESPAS